MNVETAAHRLLSARESQPISWRDVAPADRNAAFAIQDATLAAMGPRGGWKVGAKSPEGEPSCAPLPARGLVASGAQLKGGRWRLRGVELEVAVRLGRDLRCDAPPSREQLAAAIDCVLPVIEVVETRYADWREAEPLAALADLQLHGALVLGAPSALRAADVDLRSVEAYLAFDGQPVASCCGANPAGDLWRLLAWLAVHCTQRGMPLAAGDVVTTGSCTGMLFAHEGARVQGQLKGVGLVELTF